MRVLITGGAGSLGSNIIEHFSEMFEAIHVVDNFATGKRDALPIVDGLTIHEGSVSDLDLMQKVMASCTPDLIIHSAAAYKDPNNWIEDLETNAKGAAVVAKTAAEQGVSRIINFQTALCYGPPEIVPIPINHRLNPITSYGISKTAGESILLNSGLNVASLRLANVTGPRLAIGPIPTFYKKLKAGEGCTVSTTVRDFLDMSDFMSLLEMLITNQSTTGVYNVSTGKGNTILDIFNEVAKHLGMPDAKPDAIVEPGPDDIASVVLDPTKTMNDIGWTAKVGFEETISKMLNWYDEFGVTDIYSHIQKRK